MDALGGCPVKPLRLRVFGELLPLSPRFGQFMVVGFPEISSPFHNRGRPLQYWGGYIWGVPNMTPRGKMS